MDKKKGHFILSDYKALCICIFFALVLAFPLPLMAAEQKTVRVGWFENLFNITGANGERSGFGYEYQQDISSCTGWKYEYVKGDWPDLLKMLEAGEIDLLSDVSYTEERRNAMLFSDKPMGEEKYYLYKDARDTDISASDLSSINSKRVGVNKDSVQALLFARWMEEHGVAATIVPISGFPEAIELMEKGNLDAVVAPESSKWMGAGMTGVTDIGRSDVYFAINGNRSDLKEDLDRAMAKIESNNPYYAEDLYRRYMNSIGSAVLSEEEIEWLDGHGPIRIAYLKNNLAVSGINPETGEVIGAIAEYIRFAEDCLSNRTLEFEPVPYDNLIEEMQGLKKGEVDMIFQMSKNPYFGETNGFILSDTVMSTPMAAVSVSNRFNETTDNVVAVYKNNFPLKWYISFYYPNWTILECETVDETEEMVRSGKADCFVTAANRLNNYHDTKEYYSIYLSKMGKMAFATRRDDTVLMSILNQTLKVLPESLMVGALTMYSNPSRDVTLTDYVQDHIVGVASVVASVFIVILLTILFFLRQAKVAENKARKTALNVSMLNDELKKSHHQLQAALSAAESANKAKTVFLNNMSHDIRTPMNAIIGFTNIALKQRPRPEVQNCLEKIGESSDHLLTLINDVLDISRIEGGKVEYNPIPVDIARVTDAALDITRGFLLNRDLSFVVSNVRSLYVKADPVRVREVLVNILSNAVKFTNDGGTIAFETTFRPGMDDGHVMVTYRISDTGVGMSEEFLDRIFDDFSQEENGARTQYKGTGLGMAITKKYVDMMGGTISVESKKGVGSTFTVVFPLETTSSDSVVMQEPPRTTGSLEGISVMLAEDNDLNAEIAEIQLKEIGVKVTRAKDGKEAVKLFGENPPGFFDVILMDIMMPEMNGYEATKAIRLFSGRPDGSVIPIIAMTANAFAEDAEASFEAGMNAHLSKPIAMDEVTKTILRNLNG